MRYLKVTLICGTLAAILAAGLMELGAFSGLDARLALFLGYTDPPPIHRAIQYPLILILAFGIAWTTLDIVRLSLKLTVAAIAFAECVASVWVLNLFDIFFSPFAALATIPFAFCLGAFYSRTSSGRRKSTLHHVLGDRVSSQTFTALLDSNVPLHFDGDATEATVVVCEFFNHNELIAALKVRDYVTMTNAFLRNAADFLVERGGYLDECDGESIRVIFGAPLPDKNHASVAALASMELVNRLDALNRECHAEWGHRFDYRIGINSGEMIMAAYGSNRLGGFSVAGEPVEFARRLCAANSIYGSRVLLGNGAFVLAEDSIEVRPMELIQRYRDDPAREEVYELVGKRGQLSSTDRERRDTFWRGIVLFREQKWDDALTAFRQCCELDRSDGPAIFYIRRIEQLRAGMPTLTWANSKV